MSRPETINPDPPERSPGAGSTWLNSPEKFYGKLQQILECWRFDWLVDGLCARFYQKAAPGGAAVVPSIYFRLLMIGLFEGILSEEALAWRLADSAILRRFLGGGRLAGMPVIADIERTRRLIDPQMHREVFRWLLTVLRDCVLADVAGSIGGGPTDACLPWARAHQYEEFLRDMLEGRSAGAPVSSAHDARDSSCEHGEARSKVHAADVEHPRV